MAKLFLVRHGQSEWNEKGLWTGLTDIPLSGKGKEEAEIAAQALYGTTIDIAYTSVLKRAIETLEIILTTLTIPTIPTTQTPALNERDYGEYTGKNKWDIEKEVGKEMFQKLRRSWDYPIPGGESLKNVYERVIPYFKTEILPKLTQGKNVLIVAHGNSLRALSKYLENISDDDIAALEIPTGQVIAYSFENGKVGSKQILQ